MRSPLERVSTEELAAELNSRGYIVRLKGVTTLSFHRTFPFPEGCDFKNEALQMIREQLTLEHLHFEERKRKLAFEGDKTIHSAYLFF